MLYLMLTKRYGTAGGVEKKDIEWHIGEELSGRACDDLEKYSFQCVLAQADGHELEYLFSHIPALPLFYQETEATRHIPIIVPVHKWRGEWAQFIFDHLPRKWFI